MCKNIKKEGLLTGQQFVEYGSTLQLNLRTYFGPVDIEKIQIKIVDEYDRVIDLNGSDISLTLTLTCIYS